MKIIIVVCCFAYYFPAYSQQRSFYLALSPNASWSNAVSPKQSVNRQLPFPGGGITFGLSNALNERFRMNYYTSVTFLGNTVASRNPEYDVVYRNISTNIRLGIGFSAQVLLPLGTEKKLVLAIGTASSFGARISLTAGDDYHTTIAETYRNWTQYLVHGAGIEWSGKRRIYIGLRSDLGLRSVSRLTLINGDDVAVYVSSYDHVSIDLRYFLITDETNK